MSSNRKRRPVLPRRNVGISDEHWQQLRDLGDGNATKGIRLALAAVRETFPGIKLRSR